MKLDNLYHLNIGQLSSSLSLYKMLNETVKTKTYCQNTLNAKKYHSKPFDNNKMNSIEIVAWKQSFGNYWY